MKRAAPKPRLLDLFCGAGGAAMGYHRAGFEVVGIANRSQPRYPFEFIQADALMWDQNYCNGPSHLGDVDVIHASPPCQAHVQWQNLNAERYGNRVDHPDLIAPTRQQLQSTGLPYVIENVVGAPLKNSMLLCGSHFGLRVRRHRLFESNMLLLRERGCRHTGEEIAVYGKLDGRRIWTRSDGSTVRAAQTLADARDAMGIDWAEWDELREAVPPAYTEAIGAQLLGHLRHRRAA